MMQAGPAMSGASMMQAGDTAAAATADAVRQALTPHRTAYDGPAGRALAWSDDHWQAVADLGLPKLLLPEAEGGAGASLAEAAAAIEALGGLGDPSPAADTAVLAWLVSRQGAIVSDGPDGFWQKRAAVSRGRAGRTLSIPAVTR